MPSKTKSKRRPGISSAAFFIPPLLHRLSAVVVDEHAFAFFDEVLFSSTGFGITSAWTDWTCADVLELGDDFTRHSQTGRFMLLDFGLHEPLSEFRWFTHRLVAGIAEPGATTLGDEVLHSTPSLRIASTCADIAQANVLFQGDDIARYLQMSSLRLFRGDVFEPLTEVRVEIRFHVSSLLLVFRDPASTQPILHRCTS